MYIGENLLYKRLELIPVRLNSVYSRKYLLDHSGGMIFTTSDCIQYSGSIFTTYVFILCFLFGEMRSLIQRSPGERSL